MTKPTCPFDDLELQQLVFEDEDSDAFIATATHVETCVVCQQRLSLLAISEEFASEVSSLLSGYPSSDSTKEASSGTMPPLDFLAPPSHPEMLGRLGRYEIERVVGTGGMGIVLKAYDSELNRPVAIKVLAQHLAHHGAARSRFAREAKAAAAVVHEHVVAIHNVEAEQDLPFLVMQFVSGESLQARVDREGPLEIKEALRIGIQAAAGLAAAHEQGVVHRDIKPANMLLENGVERVLITDFGLARTVDDASLTHTGVVAGTPHYMSPEQANGQETDERTDLFSLGSVLYFMVTGHPPFRAERAMGVLHRICHDTHRPAWQVNTDVPDELSDLIDRLLQKKPVKRYRSAAEVREDLARLLSKLQQRTRHRRSRLASWIRRHKTLVSTVCGGLTACIVIAAIAWPRPAEQNLSQEHHSAAGARQPKVAASPEAQPVSDSLETDPAAVSAEAQRLHQRLDRLEEAASTSTFARDIGGEFDQRIESLNERLDQIDSNSLGDPIGP